MFTPMIRLGLVVCALGCAVIAQATAPETFFSNAEAARLLGQPVAGPQMIGPEPDEDAPAQATHWTFRAKDAAVVVSRLDFASASEAKKFATPAFIKKQNDQDEAEVTEEPGVGERAFWTVSEEGCAVSFLKGSHIASIALGGRNIGSPESHKAALKAAAIALAAKL